MNKETWREQFESEFTSTPTYFKDGNVKTTRWWKGFDQVSPEMVEKFIDSLLSTQRKGIVDKLEGMKPKYLGNPSMSLGIDEQARLKTLQDVQDLLSKEV